jgi:hypothetical protein
MAFVSKTPLYSKLFALTDIRSDAPPNMEELTNNVPELVPSGVNHMIGSAALSLFSLGETGSDTLYQYKFLQLQNQRVQTWYKWKLPGNLLDQFFDLSTYYAVVTNGTSVEVITLDLTQASEEGFLTLPTGEKTDVCLDMWRTNPYRTYDSATDTTRIYLGFNSLVDKTFTVLALGGYINANNQVSSQSVGAVLYPAVAGTSGNYYVDIDGDYRGRDLIIGYLYNMELELPKFYITQNESGTAQSDITGDVIIHRLKVSTGLSGPITYQINLTGIPSWNNTVQVTLPNSYTLNNVNISASAIHEVPVYQRNSNVAVKIVGDTPFPVSLLSMTWEGRYNPRFYKRV